MINRIKLLPPWNLTDKRPAFYDYESATAIEQTAKIYGAMLELQEDYNKFVAELNKTINDFITDTNADQECFKNQITKMVHDYIAMLDEKILQQDKVIEDSVIAIKNNLGEEVVRVINEMKESGELDETIANAFEGVSDRLSLIENKSNDLTNRVINLENAKVAFEYDSETESITFLNV